MLANDLLGLRPSAPVGQAKATAIRVLMGAIMFVTGTYVGVDWASYFYGFTSHYSAQAGYGRTVLCALIVLLMGDNRFAARDALLLGAAFLLALVADFFLIVRNQMIPGTVLFLVVHALFIARHAQGFRDSLAPERRAPTLRFLSASAAVAYGGAGLLIWRVAPILQRTGMFALDAVYLVFLATSMWMAWGTLARRFYDRRNAWFIAIGMSSFFLCDVSVGLAAALAGTKSGMVLNNLVGLFYSPALVLMAFSGYRWAAPGVPTSAQ